LTKRFGDVVQSATTGKFRQLSVKEAWLNTLVGLELVILFYVGEVVGRGSLIGYDVSRVQPKFPFW
jgi:F-type H+-transporting ATPase subunit g